MRRSKRLSFLFIPIAGLVVLSAQAPKTFKARLSPVPIDIAMQATVAGSGSVAAVLTGSKLSISGTLVSGSFDLTASQVADLEKGRLYVQLHSEKAPDGNLWGWLLLPESRR